MGAHILNDFIVVNCTSPEVDTENECIHFLTHIGRHQKELSNVISSHVKKVYTSEFNIWYLKTFFNVNTSQFVSVPLWTKRKVKSKGSTFTFEFLNANHCPGAVMILIKGDFGTYLYTGNCRYNPAMLDYSSLRPYSQGIKILEKLYVNAPYLKIEINFPKREVVVQQIIEFISEHSEEKIYICSRLLGKEDILFRIALELNEKIYVSQDKLKVLNKLGYKSNSFTTVMAQARLRIVDVNEITRVKMKRRRLTEKCVGIIFSACHNNSEMLKKHGIYVFPASDHSSAAETKLMIKSLCAKDIYLLNRDSTLSEYIKSQQNLGSQKPFDNASSGTTNSLFIPNQKSGKKRLSLKLNPKNDENISPLHCSVGLMSSNKGTLVSRDNVLKENNIYKNKKPETKKITFVRSKNTTVSSEKVSKELKIPFLGGGTESATFPDLNENSFLLDENAQTGFTSSGDQSNIRSQRSYLSPSFPPSVSNIVLTEASKIHETSLEHYHIKQSFTSTFGKKYPKSTATQTVRESSKNATGSEPSSDHSSSEFVCNYTYQKMSSSYPPSVSNIILTRPSETKTYSTKLKTGGMLNNNDEVSATQKTCQHSSENVESSNTQKKTSLLKSKTIRNGSDGENSEAELTSQVNNLSPSFPPSESNIVLTRLSDKAQNEEKNMSCDIATKMAPNQATNGTSPSNQLSCSRKNANSTTVQNIPLLNCKSLRFSPNHIRPCNQESCISLLPSENLTQDSKVNENGSELNKMDSTSAKKCPQLIEPEVVSESTFSCSNIDETQSVIPSQEQSSYQRESVSMVQTRIFNSNEECAVTDSSTVNFCQNEVMAISASQSDTFNLQSNVALGKFNHEIPVQVETNKSNSHSLPGSLGNNITGIKSIFVIDQQNHSEVHVDKNLLSSVGTSAKSIVISINNTDDLKACAGLAHSLMKDLEKTNSLFTADIFNKSNNKLKINRGHSVDHLQSNKALFQPNYSNELLNGGGTLKQANEHFRQEQNGSVVSEPSEDDSMKVDASNSKNDKVLADQTTVCCLINHQVVCQVHSEDPPKSRAKLKSDFYEQSTLFSDTQKLPSPSTTSVNKLIECSSENVVEDQSNPSADNLECSKSSTNVSSFPLKDLADSDAVPSKTKDAGKNKTCKRNKSQSIVASEGNVLSQSSGSEQKIKSLPILRSSFKTFAKKSCELKSKSTSFSQSVASSQNLNDSSFSSKSSVSKSNQTNNLTPKISSNYSKLLNSNQSQTDAIKNNSYIDPSSSEKNHCDILPLNKKSNVDLFSSTMSINGSALPNNLDSLIEKNKTKSLRSSSQSDIFSKTQTVKSNNTQILLKPPLSLTQPNLSLTASAKKQSSSSLPSNQPSPGSSLKKTLNELFSSSFSLKQNP